MEMTSYGHGVPSWVDHSSPDPVKAGEFYAGVFGWEINEASEEFGGYTMATKNGKNVAGIGPQMGGPGPSYWATYINVDSADDVTEKVRANGGNVLVEPMDVSEEGRMAVFADPAGAAIGIWQAGRMKGAELVNEAGTLGWNELVTSDVEGSKAFYGAVFGWDSASHVGGPPGGYTEWKAEGRAMAGMMAKPPGMPAEIPSFWGIYFVVSDVDATVAKATDLGGGVSLPAFDSPQGRLAGIIDPFGATFNVITPTGVPQP